MTAFTSRALPFRVPSLRRLLAVAVMLGATALASACGAPSPQATLESSFTKTGGTDPGFGITFTSPKSPDVVVREIASKTEPDDSIVSGDSTFLRYGSEWMVVVHGPTPPARTGSTVELWTFDAGYARYSAEVAAWDEFRGGGSGEGK